MKAPRDDVPSTTIEEYVAKSVMCECEHYASIHDKNHTGPCDGVVSPRAGEWLDCPCRQFVAKAEQ